MNGVSHIPWPQVLAAATAMGGVAAAGVGAWGAFAPRSSLFGPVIWRGEANDAARVSLTFDDGPHPEATPAILDCLRDHGVAATFFVIGAHARGHPELLARMHAEGHLIANHSFDHHYSGMFGGGAYWDTQIARTDDAIVAAIGRRPLWFRPPMGFKQVRLARAVGRASHSMITWTRRGFDGVASTSDAIVRRLGDSSRAGDILLLHDGGAPAGRRDWRPTARALPRMIQTLRRRGLEPVRLDAMIAPPPYLTC